MLCYFLAYIVSIDVARVILVPDLFVYDLLCFVLLSGKMWNLLSVPRVMKFHVKRDFRRHVESIDLGNEGK